MSIIDKQTFRSGPFQQIFAHGVRVGNVLHLAGQVSLDQSGNVVGDNLGEQMRQTYTNIKSVIAEFGGDMGNIVDETLFVTDMGHVMNDIETFCGVREEAYGETPEVSQTLVQVAGLVLPELLVEIKCVAHL